MLTPETLFLTHLAGERVNRRLERSRRSHASAPQRERTRPTPRRTLWTVLRRTVRSVRSAPGRA
jgi:hypothetical protein